MTLQLLRRRARASEGDHVLTEEMIEQIARAPAEELYRPIGQNARLDDAREHPLGEKARRRRRLDDRRQPGEQRRGELLEHAPHRKVECVDVNGRAFARDTNVLAEEGPALREQLRASVHVDMAIGQLALTLARV